MPGRGSSRLHHVHIVRPECIVVSMAEVITLRLPREMLEELDGLAEREHRDRSAVIRDLLERGVGEKRIEHAVDLYRSGRVTGWKAAATAEGRSSSHFPFLWF